MGLRDRREALLEQKESLKRDAGPSGFEYDTEVNKGSVNMMVLTQRLNDRASKGWRLHTMFEQAGNTVCVFERET